MKLFPPEPKVDLYNEGFGADDFLNRKPTGKALSDLVERIEDPLVIVLDGPWGSGKSYFLTRWVGAHTIENSGEATTVYFDAFANDFLDDPLTGLAGAVNERLPDNTDPKARRLFKGAIAKLRKPVVRTGMAALTAGLSEMSGPIVDAMISAGGSHLEQAVDDFWKREDGKREAMKEVERSLLSITQGANGLHANKLVIVIDELDRCRPDYALAVLETIKHFFAVSNVHFILGVNMVALEHSVRARYGNDIDAEGYLRRFISLTTRFPIPKPQTDDRTDARTYWLRQGRLMGLPSNLLENVDRQLALRGRPGVATIRDINRLLSLAALMPGGKEFNGMGAGYQIVIGSMLVARALQPSFFEKMRSRRVTVNDIRSFYGITDEQTDENSSRSGQYNQAAVMLIAFWQFLSSPENAQVDEQIARSFDGFSLRPREIDLDQLAREHFDTFALVRGGQDE